MKNIVNDFSSSRVAKNTMKKYPYIDFLKLVGLFCIILAHVGPPAVVMQLRNFDVPLMVILSGMLAANSQHLDKSELGGG